MATYIPEGTSAQYYWVCLLKLKLVQKLLATRNDNLFPPMPLPTLPQTWDYNTRFINDCVIPFNSKSITIKQSPKGLYAHLQQLHSNKNNCNNLDLDTLQKLNSLLKVTELVPLCGMQYVYNYLYTISWHTGYSCM